MTLGFQYLPERLFTQHLIGRSCRCSLCLVDYWSGRARTNVFLVRFDPVGRYLALGGLDIQLAGAHELVEFPLKRILHIGVPARSLG